MSLNLFYKINEEGYFNDLTEVQDFHFIRNFTKNKDYKSFQMDFLLVNKIWNALDYLDASLNEKASILSTYANENQEFAIFCLLDLILHDSYKPFNIDEFDLDNIVLFGWLSNIGCGNKVDNSVINGINRVVELCLQNGLIKDSIDELYYDDNEIDR